MLHFQYFTEWVTYLLMASSALWYSCSARSNSLERICTCSKVADIPVLSLPLMQQVRRRPGTEEEPVSHQNHQRENKVGLQKFWKCNHNTDPYWFLVNLWLLAVTYNFPSGIIFKFQRFLKTQFWFKIQFIQRISSRNGPIPKSKHNKQTHTNDEV